MESQLFSENLNKINGVNQMHDKKTSQAFGLQDTVFARSLNDYVKVKKFD